VLLGGYARRRWAPDYPDGIDDEGLAAFLKEIGEGWGGPVGLALRAPSRIADPRFRETWSRYLRAAASPGAALALTRMNGLIDIRPILPTIRVPTLVIHRTGDRAVLVGTGRYLAEHIPGARLAELPGDDHLPWVGDADAILGEIEEFLTGIRHEPPTDRVLSTVLFTDIVGSTERASRLGDSAWQELLDAHHVRVREQLTRYAGVERNTTGDGFVATFDGPARAIQCAFAIMAGLRPLDLEIRAGVHTGEIQISSAGIAGLAVHVGAGIAAIAGPDEVLVSRVVRDLVAGSGITFESRGTHQLKGVPDDVEVFAATATAR